MVFLKKLPSPLFAGPILEYIQSDSSKACTGWFIGKCLDQFFGDPKYSTQLKNMNKIDEEFDKMKQETPKELQIRTDWEHLNTRIFQAEMGINHKYKVMQSIMSNANSEERRHEASELRNGILDSNNGVLSNLSVIHQVLVGQTATNHTEKGLLEMWSEGIYNNMRINPMSAKIYVDFVDMYMNKAAIIQFKGILLFTGASTNSRFCLRQIELFTTNLEIQIKKIEQTVPSFMKYLSDPDEKQLFVMRPILDSDFEPFIRRRGPGRKLINDFFGDNIEEGKWNFEKSPSFVNDGSLLISGSSSINGQRYYMRVSEKNKAECVSEKCRATPFYVIPLSFEENKMETIICKSESDDQRFLGNKLKFIDEQDDIKFTLSFDCV